MDAHFVTVHAVSDVVPASPTPQPCLRDLSNIDLMLSGNTYTKQVYYYKAAEIPYSQLVQSLKESLSRALVDFYILAGRIAIGENGVYHVNCNDSGVPFREATTEARFKNWEDVRKSEIEEHLNPAELFIADYTKAPLIQIQVTKFSCGIIAIGYVVSEMVVDGHSSMEFFTAWSEVHRGLPLSNPPTFDLGKLLQARVPPMVKEPVRDYVASKIPMGSASINYKMLEDSTLYHNKLFRATPSKIEALIREIDQGPFSYGKATAFEAMAALVWKSMTHARELAEDVVTTYLYPLSLRDNSKRWEPAIPKGCFGNAVHIACLRAKSGDIKSRHISYAANLIHNDILSMSMETYKSAIDWMQIQRENGFQVGFNCDMYGGTDVHCTSMYTFPIYKADFGFGKPIHFSLILHPWFGDGVAFMLPTANGGRDREISIAMPGAQLKKLAESDLFHTFVEEY